MQSQNLNPLDLPLERREFLSLILAGVAATFLADDSEAATSDAQMSKTLGAFVDVLIPSDEQTPAASSLGVHERIMTEARETALFQRLIRVVITWLDKQSTHSFANLAEERKIALVEWMSAAPWESPQRRFFEIVRDRSMWFYYGRAESWTGLPMTTPPQPMGYVLE